MAPPTTAAPTMKEPGSTRLPPAAAKRLSHTSTKFDIGGKGFLTAAEQAARELDFNDEGRISNEQVVSLVERTEDLRKSNKTLRQWLMGVLCVTVVFGAAQICTAIVAARLAQDSEADSTTGLLTVKGTDTPVVVVSTGRTVVIDLEDDGSFCMAFDDMVDMFSETIQGSPTNAIFQTTDDGTDEDVASNVRVDSWVASGTSYNSTTACINTATNQLYCFDYYPCSKKKGEDAIVEPEHRLLHRQNEHRQLFHEEMKRRLGGVGAVGGLDLGVDRSPGNRADSNIGVCRNNPCPQRR